jgi:uncharacterized protein (DUF1697 family)
MREEYFMNYDFLRKYGDKVDAKGRSFRMLDFEDGGMYFGVVEGELPSGVGAYVYADLKFHCGVYKNGLMHGLSRIHFGNGDVFDGEAMQGQMHGQGYFFDCENNDWVFGHFESDNCLEVYEHGEAFPREEINRFRASLHQSSPHYLSKVTDPLIIDFDILLDYANRDITHLTPQKDQQIPPGPQGIPEEGLEWPEDEQSKKEKLHEMYRKALLSQEKTKPPKESVAAPSTAPTAKSKTKDKVYSVSETHVSVNSKVSSVRGKTKRRDSGTNPEEAEERRHPPLKTERGDHPLLVDSASSRTKTKEKISPISERTKNASYSGERAKRGVIPNVSNQIVVDAHIVKPKSSKNAKQETFQESLQEHINNLKNEISNYSSAKDKDESRDLRNISIQTDDHHPIPYEQHSNNEDASITYLKGIHNMIGELKQMVAEKIPNPSLLAEALLHPSHASAEGHLGSSQPSDFSSFRSPSGGVPSFSGGTQVASSFQYQNKPQQATTSDPSALTKLSDLRHLITPLGLQSPSSLTQWNEQIDREIEERRQKEIEEALANKFGPVQAVEVDENNIGEDVVALEPIKESIDEEDEDGHARVYQDQTSSNSLLTQTRIKELKGRQNSAAGLATITISNTNPSASIYRPTLSAGLGDAGESTIEVRNEFAKTADDKFFENPMILEQRNGSVEAVMTRRLHGGMEKITEADEKEFYRGDPLFPKVKAPENNQQNQYDLFKQSKQEAIQPNFNQAPLTHQHNDSTSIPVPVTPINTSCRDSSAVPETGRFPQSTDDLGKFGQTFNIPGTQVISGTSPYQQLQLGGLQPPLPAGHLKIPSVEPKDDRESNFMYSNKGGESHNSTSRLPINDQPVRRSRERTQEKQQTWLFFNPYLYEASWEVDINQNFN